MSGFRKANKWFLAYGHHPCARGLARPTPSEMDEALREQLAEDAEVLAASEAKRDAEWDDRAAACSLCAAPVIVHDDGSATGGVDTLLGIRCDSCLNMPESAKEGTTR